MPSEPIRAPLGVNVPGFAMAGFQVTLHGRIWVTAEVQIDPIAIKTDIVDAILAALGRR